MGKKLNNLINDGTFDSTYVSPLNKNSYANIFDVVNRGERSYFNLCRGIRFNHVDKMDESKYSNYVVVESDSWTTISYRFYHTVELWWLICKFNNIKNPFKELIPGTVIKIPSDEVKDIILSVLSSY